MCEGETTINLVGEYEMLSDDAAINAISWHITHCIMRRQLQTGASSLPSPDRLYNDLVASQIQKSSSSTIPTHVKDMIYRVCPTILNLVSKPYMQSIISRVGLSWFVTRMVRKSLQLKTGLTSVK